jgi:hypothetical protein
MDHISDLDIKLRLSSNELARVATNIGVRRTEVVADLERLVAQRDELDLLISSLTNELRSMDAVLARGDEGPQPRGRKRDAVLAVFPPSGESIKLGDLRDSLIASRAILPTKREAHALQMMIGALVAEGLVDRVGTGEYALRLLAGPELADRISDYGGKDEPLDPGFFGRSRGDRQDGGE